MGDGARRGSRHEQTLTLLLSPHADRPVNDVKFRLATESEIRRALFDHKKNGAGAKRLWFFYAGHGLAPAGGGPDEAPVVVPSDVKDRTAIWRPINLGHGSARCRSASRSARSTSSTRAGASSSARIPSRP